MILNQSTQFYLLLILHITCKHEGININYKMFREINLFS